MFQTILAILSSSACTASIGWLMGRSKSKAETEKIRLDNINNVIDIYKEATEDLIKEVQGLRAEVNQLRIENKTLKSEITKLEKTLAEFQHN